MGLPLPAPGADLQLAGEGSTPTATDWQSLEGLEDYRICSRRRDTGDAGDLSS